MQTRNGLTYGEPIHFLQKVEQKTESLGLAPPFPKVELKVEVDFDEASSAWKLNKKSIGDGCYKYVCVKIKKTGTQCKNDSIKNCEHCKYHSLH